MLAVAWVALSEPGRTPADFLLAPSVGAEAARWTLTPSAPVPAIVALAGASDGADEALLPRVRASAALVAPQVAVFSRVALVAAAATATAGLVNAWLRLGGTDASASAAARAAALTGSRYGWLLLAKVAAVLVVAGVGAVNWRRNTPRLTGPDGVAALDRATRAELGAAVVVLVLSAALALTSPPGAE